MGPVGPVEPGDPVGPVLPGDPVGPVDPGVPVGPVPPVGPVEPGVPVGPVLPTAPDTPPEETPCAVGTVAAGAAFPVYPRFVSTAITPLVIEETL